MLSPHYESGATVPSHLYHWSVCHTPGLRKSGLQTWLEYLEQRQQDSQALDVGLYEATKMVKKGHLHPAPFQKGVASTDQRHKLPPCVTKVATGGG